MNEIPSPSEIRYFIEVSNTENMSRAAERLGISQPSLTQAIRRLEHTVGTDLFFRSKKGVVLTPAGKTLLTRSRELLQTWEEVRTRAANADSEVSGRFSIGAHPSVALYSFKEVLPELLSQFPDLELELIHGLSREILEGVVSSRIDVGVVVNPVRHPDLVLTKIADDEVAVWTRRSNPSQHQNHRKNAILICDPNLLQTKALLKKLEQSEVHFSRVLYSSSLEVISSLVASGSGVGILPGRVAQTNPVLKKVKDTPLFHDEHFVAYRIENKKVRAILTIARGIAQAFRAPEEKTTAPESRVRLPL